MRRLESSQRADEGFTLIELLVVMIVVGVLAAIAIPTFLDQRARAHDVSTRSDVSILGKEIATYYVDGGSGLSLDLMVEPGRAVISDSAGFRESVRLTNGTARPATGSAARLEQPNGWCVSLTDDAGKLKDFRFSAGTGLEPGTC